MKSDPLVHELLRDLRELTSRQFVYEDFWCGMVPFDGHLSELQTGPPVPFAELTWREQADVLRSFIHWNRYPAAAWDDEYKIRDNIAAGKQPEQWLDGTSFLDPGLQAERREKLIQETFELSRQIGYAHFLAENFDRADPALVRLSSEEREAFLREWWDAASERMYASYREQVADLSEEQLAENKAAYKTAIAHADAKGPGIHYTIAAKPDGQSPGPNDHTPSTLANHLFGPSISAALPHTQDKVHFNGYVCEIEERTYPNGRLALVLVDPQGKEDVVVATVNLPELPLKADEVFIKDYSENTGMLEALEKAGIVKATGERVPTGYVDVPIAKVLSLAQRQQPQGNAAPDNVADSLSTLREGLFSETLHQPEPQPESTQERHHKR